MSIRIFLAAGIAAFAITPMYAADTKPARPNILIIVADDLGYADLGVQGCKDIPTPNIDSIAKNGVRCTSGYVSCPYCSPTRAGLLTGRYQNRFGHEFNPGPPNNANKEVGLSLKETTLADRLKSAGYRTGMVGKWHLGHVEKFNPINRGFEEYFGFLGGAHPYNGNGPANNPVVRGTKPVEQTEYLTESFGKEAVACIDRHQKEPFFLYLTFNAVHAPMHANDKYMKRFEDIKNMNRRKYAAMLSAMDDAVGAVLAKLKASGLEENTLVCFISDNGGPEGVNFSDNGPLRGVKATTWEGGIRVPFFLHWKGMLPAGKTYDHPVIALDLNATILSAAGVEAKAEWKLDGVNLLPYLKGEKTGAPHEALFWRFGQQAAIRMGDWKLVKARGALGTQQGQGGVASTLEDGLLFNLTEEIGEQTDLAKKHPERVKELAAAWAKWNAELQKPAWGAPGMRN